MSKPKIDGFDSLSRYPEDELIIDCIEIWKKGSRGRWDRQWRKHLIELFKRGE